MRKQYFILILIIPAIVHPGWIRTYGHDLWDCEGKSIVQTNNGNYLVTSKVIYNLQTEIYLLYLNSRGDSIWANTYGGNQDDYPYNGIETFDGGYAVFGWTKSHGAGLEDAWLIKTDDQGDIIWSKTYGEYSLNDYGIHGQQTSDSGYVITGYHGNWGSYHVWLIKTDQQGDTVWTRTFGQELGSENKGLAVQQTDDDGFIVVGQTNYNFPEVDIYIIRTDQSGNLRWSQIYGLNQTGNINPKRGLSVDQTDDGGFIIAGTAYYSGHTHISAYLLKIDSLGRKEWEKIFGGSSWDQAMSVKQCEDQGYIITGWTCSFGNGNQYVYLIRTDSMGDSMWTRIYGGIKDDGANWVELSADGGFIICGFTESFATYHSAIYVIKTDSLGVAVEENIISSPQQNCFAVTTRGNLRTRISFSLTQAGQVSVDVYDLSGRNVSSPVEGYYPAGEHCIYWQAPLPGVYFFRIRSDQLDKTVKTAVLR